MWSLSYFFTFIFLNFLFQNSIIKYFLLSPSESKWASVLKRRQLPVFVCFIESIYFFYLCFSITFFGAWFNLYSRITSCFLNLLWRNLLTNWYYLKLIYLMLDFFLLNLYGFYFRLAWISVGYLWLSIHEARLAK